MSPCKTEKYYLIGDLHLGRNKIYNSQEINPYFKPFETGIYKKKFKNFYIQKVSERFREILLRDILKNVLEFKDTSNCKLKKINIILLGDVLDYPKRDIDYFLNSDVVKRYLIEDVFLKIKKTLNFFEIPFTLYVIFGNHELKSRETILTSMSFYKEYLIRKLGYTTSELELITEQKPIFIECQRDTKTLKIFIPFITNNLGELREFFFSRVLTELRRFRDCNKNEIENVFIFTHNNIYLNDRWFNYLTIPFSEFDEKFFKDGITRIFPNLKNFQFFNGHIHKDWFEDKLNVVGSFFPLTFKISLQAIGFYTFTHLYNPSNYTNNIIENYGLYNNHLILLKHLLNDYEKVKEYLDRIERYNRERAKIGKFTLQVIPHISKTVFNKLKEFEEYKFTIPYYIVEDVNDNLERVKDIIRKTFG